MNMKEYKKQKSAVMSEAANKISSLPMKGRYELAMKLNMSVESLRQYQFKKGRNIETALKIIESLNK